MTGVSLQPSYQYEHLV